MPLIKNVHFYYISHYQTVKIVCSKTDGAQSDAFKVESAETCNDFFIVLCKWKRTILNDFVFMSLNHKTIEKLQYVHILMFFTSEVLNQVASAVNFQAGWF